MAGPGPKHNGWWKDNHNERLYFYQNGTAIGYIDAVSGLEILTGSLNVSGGSQVMGGLTVDGGLNVSGATTINDQTTYADTFYHVNASTNSVTGAAMTLGLTDSGRLILDGITGSTITLPTAPVVGVNYTIINTAADAAGSVKITP